MAQVLLVISVFLLVLGIIICVIHERKLKNNLRQRKAWNRAKRNFRSLPEDKLADFIERYKITDPVYGSQLFESIYNDSNHPSAVIEETPTAA